MSFVVISFCLCANTKKTRFPRASKLKVYCLSEIRISLLGGEMSQFLSIFKGSDALLGKGSRLFGLCIMESL